jgi:hypothetical protein
MALSFVVPKDECGKVDSETAKNDEIVLAKIEKGQGEVKLRTTNLI